MVVKLSPIGWEMFNLTIGRQTLRSGVQWQPAQYLNFACVGISVFIVGCIYKNFIENL